MDEKRRTEKRRSEKKQGTEKRRSEKKVKGGKRQTEKKRGESRRTEEKRGEDKSQGGKRHNCEHNMTMHGLQKWYETVFKNLGWKVLAHNRGTLDDINKVMVYKNSIRQLMEKIECKLKSVSDHDNKQDLKIMWDNVKILLDHTEKDF